MQRTSPRSLRVPVALLVLAPLASSLVAAPLAGGGEARPEGAAGWTTWWEANREVFLEVPEGGSSIGILCGLPPPPEDADRRVRHVFPGAAVERIHAAIVTVLQAETDPEVLRAALIALANVSSEAYDEGGGEDLDLLVGFLAARDPEVQACAALALGIHGDPRAIPLLASVVLDDRAGRALAGAPGGIAMRTRAMAAHGLGLLGDVPMGQTVLPIVRSLARASATRGPGARELVVAGVVGLGYVPLECKGEDGPGGPTPLEALDSPAASLLDQIAYLRDFLADTSNDPLARAQAPVALALIFPSVPRAQREGMASAIAADLDGCIARAGEGVPALARNAIRAAGILGRSEDELGASMRRTLRRVQTSGADAQTRGLALLALAEAGSSGRRPCREALDALREASSSGDFEVRAWSELAAGVLGRKLADAGTSASGADACRDELGRLLRTEFSRASSAQEIGAGAIALGLLGDGDAGGLLLGRLACAEDEETRGHLAVGLGLIKARDAIEPIAALVGSAGDRPRLLLSGVTALELLSETRWTESPARLVITTTDPTTSAGVAAALGRTGDAAAVDPLLRLLQDRARPARMRAFAVTALGELGTVWAHPWSVRLGRVASADGATPLLAALIRGTPGSH